MSQQECDDRLEQLLHLFDFASHRYEVIESFSHGMRQKVFVIGALLSDPDIWVLDEPMTGLDPQASYDLKQMMREHADKAIPSSSPLMSSKWQSNSVIRLPS